MEYFMIGLISGILFLVLLGWIIIGASPLIVPLVGSIYLIIKTRELIAYSKESTQETRDCVLVVDDQYSSVIPLIKLLEQSKVPFKYVSDGIEAIKELSEHEFRLIFMDQYMPKLTGSETLAAADIVIKSQNQMPVIFYSGTDMKHKMIHHLEHLLVLGSWEKTLSRMELQNRLAQLQLVPI